MTTALTSWGCGEVMHEVINIKHTMSDVEQGLNKLNKYLLQWLSAIVVNMLKKIFFFQSQYVKKIFFFSNYEVIEESSLSTNSSRNLFVGSQARHTSPLPPFFLGSLPSPKPGNLVILIMKKKHVLFKIPAAEYSAMLFLSLWQQSCFCI